jgi:hypothetical protein
MIAFTARVGPGFYWFAAYCLFSLASQQLTVRMVTTDANSQLPASNSQGKPLVPAG